MTTTGATITGNMTMARMISNMTVILSVVAPGNLIVFPSSLLFDSPCFLLTSLILPVPFILKAVLDFRDELPAMEANCANPDPPPLDADVASLDVALSNGRLALASSAFDAVGAKVMRLEFHSRYTIKLGRFRRPLFFGKQFIAMPSWFV